MTTLVVGATGATGKLLVEQLLGQGEPVRVIVRSPEKLGESIKSHPDFDWLSASLLDLDSQQLSEYVEGCRAAASCLGHSLTPQGIWGQPRLLVTEAARRLSQALAANSVDNPKKFVLMNTVGNHNPETDQRLALGERLATGVMRWLLPPQRDNELAADYLQKHIGSRDPIVEWVVVRPDTLIDQDQVSRYTISPSPVQSPLFGDGETSRVNVANFMARLILDDELWGQWQGQMPVIYNHRPLI